MSVSKGYCVEHAERRCRSYPHCEGCNSHNLFVPEHVIVEINGNRHRVPFVNFIHRLGEPQQVIIPFDIDLGRPTLKITNVIFNPPATIVFWSDKTKTVVKCDYTIEPYDPEKGIAMAISKKMLGDNKYEYYNVFKHWLKRWDQKKLKNRTLTPSISEDNPTEFYR